MTSSFELRFQALSLQGDGPLNEDTYLVGPRQCGVFDGVTSLTGVRTLAGMTGGGMAAERARDVFAADETTPLGEVAERANRAVADAMAAAGVNPASRTERWGTTAAVVRLEGDTLAWLNVGDSRILVLDRAGRARCLPAPLDHDRALRRRRRELAHVGLAGIREHLAAELRAVRERSNVDFGVLNGEPEMTRFVETGRVALAELRCVLLVTDGLLPPAADPDAEPDWQEYLDRFVSRGLGGLADWVRDRERGDPEGLKYPRVKAHDDLTGVVVTVATR